LRDAEAELVVSLVGTDETMAQTVHARWSYLADEILFDHRYADMIRFLPNGLRAVELAQIDQTMPLTPGASELAGAARLPG
jgi:inward rectifier potassium channel